MLNYLVIDVKGQFSCSSKMLADWKGANHQIRNKLHYHNNQYTNTSNRRLEQCTLTDDLKDLLN